MERFYVSSKNTVDYLAVVCGKNFILNMWADYILQLPTKKYPGNLIVVDNCTDPNYQKKLFTILAREEFRQKFNTVSVTFGPGKFKPKAGVPWRHPSVNSGKHDSTADAFNIGFSRCTSKWVVTIDDDTFIRGNGVEKLIDTIIDKGDRSNISCVTGLYLTKPFADTYIPAIADRTLVLSVAKDTWRPVQIDDIYNTGLVEVGYCGTGAAAWKNHIIKTLPPTFTDNSLGPDAVLCKHLRNAGQRIMAETTILAEHWGKQGRAKPVAVGVGVDSILEQYKREKTVLVAAPMSHGPHIRHDTLECLVPIYKKYKCDCVVYWMNDIELTSETRNKYPDIEFIVLNTEDSRLSRKNDQKITYGDKGPWLRAELAKLYTTRKYTQVYDLLPAQDQWANVDMKCNFKRIQEQFRHLRNKKLTTGGLI